MNWDAISAIAENLGAVAVILSLVYLAIQVGQTRIQLKAQAEDTITARAFDAYAPIYEGNNASVFRKGLEDPEALNTDEAFLFKLLMDRQRGAFATIVRNAMTGSVSAEMSNRLLDGYRHLFLQTNGGRQWFASAQHLMSKPELKLLHKQ